MAKSYNEIMAEVRAGWTDDELRLSQAANEHFAAVRQEIFHLGESLKIRREELGLSQREVATLTGIQQAEISRIERDRGNPTLTTLRKIMDVLRLDLRLTTY